MPNWVGHKRAAPIRVPAPDWPATEASRSSRVSDRGAARQLGKSGSRTGRCAARRFGRCRWSGTCRRRALVRSKFARCPTYPIWPHATSNHPALKRRNGDHIIRSPHQWSSKPSAYRMPKPPTKSVIQIRTQMAGGSSGFVDMSLPMVARISLQAASGSLPLS